MFLNTFFKAWLYLHLLIKIIYELTSTENKVHSYKIAVTLTIFKITHNIKWANSFNFYFLYLAHSLPRISNKYRFYTFAFKYT